MKSRREDVCRSYKRLWTWEGRSRHCAIGLRPILDTKTTTTDSKMNWRQTVASLLICLFFSPPSHNLDQIKINPAARISSVTHVYHYFISVDWNQKPVNSIFLRLVPPLSLTLWIIPVSFPSAALFVLLHQALLRRVWGHLGRFKRNNG